MRHLQQRSNGDDGSYVEASAVTPNVGNPLCRWTKELAYNWL